MHPHILFAPVFLAVMGGCVSTHIVDANKTDEWIRPAQDILLGEDVTVRTVDNRAYNGKLILLSPDSVKLRDDEGGALVTENLSNVVFLGEPTNATAPILGCLGGAVVGLLIGGAIGAEEPEASSGGVNTISSAAIGGLIGGVVGGAAGVTIGGLATKVDQYEIHQSGKRPAAKPDSGPEKK
jgi:hypothetical protein